MSIYLTGDIHGEMSVNRCSHKRWLEGRNLTKDDYLIIAGDFGLIYHPEQTSAERYWLKWLAERPFSVLWVDGNHENFDRLNQLPLENKFGGLVGRVADSIFHLRRGEIYQIQDKKILAFGGAASSDKIHRVEHISWWKEEVPSYQDMDHCLENLYKHQNEVDIIVAHTCPFSLVSILLAWTKKYEGREIDPTTKMLEHIVSTTKFSDFYCGHWHIDREMSKYHFVYEKILKIV